MSSMKGFLSVLCVAALACACSRPGDAPAITLVPNGVTKSGHVISLGGAIDADMAQAFEREIDNGVTTIVVYSGGGEVESSIEIGREIHRRGLDVVVSGLCAADCARFIFVAGRSRSMEDNSLVLFNQSASSLLAVADRNPSPAASELIDKYEAQASSERAFYAELGVPEALLLQPLVEMRPQCFSYVTGTNGLFSDISVRTSYIAWGPSAQFMANAGLSADGWPTTPAEISAAYRSVFRPGTPDSQFAGDDELVTDEVIAEALDRIPPCPLQDVALLGQ
jgi:hypothetical protein